jgi:hypothetical protein
MTVKGKVNLEVIGRTGIKLHNLASGTVTKLKYKTFRKMQ